MKNNLLCFLKKIIFFIGILFFSLLFLNTNFNKKVGDIFFGQNYYLYNTNTAQFFFKRAAYPLTGKAAPFAHYQLSRTYFIQGNFDTAIDEANKELELYPKNCRTYYIRGLTYGYMEKLDEAITDFETFNNACVKDSWAGHNDLAWFYFRKGDIANMRKTIEKVVPLYDMNPWVQNTYGLALLNEGKYKEALAAFEKALYVAEHITEKEWGIAYPGNNPEIYGKGLDSMRTTIHNNLQLAKNKSNNE